MKKWPGWVAPLMLFLLALAVYWGALWLYAGTPFPQSRWPYFIYYAGALLDGRLDFGVLPPAGLDLSIYEGRVYMPFPPFPSVPFLPWVAVFGLGGSDRFACVLLAAANGPLFYAVLAALDRSGLARVPEHARILLCLFFLFGTPHLHLAIASNLWGFAHIVCIALLLTTLWAILVRRPLVAALAFAAILFTRTHVVLVAPALIGLHWMLQARDDVDLAGRVRSLLPAAGVVALGVGLLLAFNHARFDDPLETGISYHRMSAIFRQRFDTWGAFHPAYLPRNLRVLLLGMPVASNGFPWFSFSPAGLSLFVASPLYVYLFNSLRPSTRRLAATLWLGVGLTAIPILFFMGTGELQFGYRYATDLQPLLVLLTFLGMGEKKTRGTRVLLAASIAMNAYGAWWFMLRYAG